MHTSILKRLQHFSLNHRYTLLAVAIFFIATASFMWPAFTHLSTYSDGGDHMFNAWTLARNHYCLIGQGCPHYENANIFFPNKDSMLYSETQLSAGILTLPFFFINQNPLFSSNIWYFLSAFFSGLFMYMLARYLSKGNQPVSLLAGLLFEFAPTKISSMDHLQNLSIFYLPLIILLLLKYRDTGRKKYLAWFTVACALLFLASWYQMVFGLLVIGLFILYVLVTDSAVRKRGWLLVAGTFLAVLTTLPLAKDYVHFSKAHNAGFSIQSQIAYSSSIDDYWLPYQGTPLGSVYYKLKPGGQHSTHDQDSFSYTGVTLYIIGLLCLLEVFRRKRSAEQKERNRLIILLAVVSLAGFIISLGPVLKIGFQYTFQVKALNVVIAMPYLLVDKFLPQLSFMRAVGRASVIVLFALCCLLALYAIRLKAVRDNRKRILLTTLLVLVIGLDMLPNRLLTQPLQKINPFEVSFSVPAVYKYIKDHKAIDNLVVLRTEKDYPNASLPTANAEDVLWSGYDNRNIFNGYSGYYPPGYQATLQGFDSLQPGTADKMKSLGLKYVLLDKQLSANSPGIESRMAGIFSTKVYEDSRYVLFRV